MGVWRHLDYVPHAIKRGERSALQVDPTQWGGPDTMQTIGSAGAANMRTSGTRSVCLH